jgi:dynein heavy chain
MTEHVTLSI